MTSRFLFSMLIMLAVALFSGGPAIAQIQPLDREDIVVIQAGRVITGTGEAIDRGKVVIIDGSIAAVGRNVEYPKYARVIDARDETIMPGLIHTRTRQGLPGYSRTGARAHLKVSDEVYLDLLDFDDLVEAGFTAVCLIPAGVGIPGRAAVYRTAGNDKDRRVHDPAYLRVTMNNPGRDKGVLRDALRRAQEAIDKEKEARKEWEQKRDEAERNRRRNQESGDNDKNAADDRNDDPGEFEPPEIDRPLRPLVDLIRREPGVVAMIEISNAADLLHADDVTDRYEGLPLMYYLSPGTGDFTYVVDQLGEREALILTGPEMATLPNTVVRYNVVAELFAAGAEVAMYPSGSPQRMRAMLADLVRAGLPRDEAMRSMTINPARIAGVQERLGTLEPGKDGDIIFLDGDPLDGHSRVRRTMIRGEIVWTRGDDS